jgi:peptidoglycan/xylan/chitin deacetylase (PgdA/CDA1 family)
MKSKVALVGAGYWGKNLARNFYEIGCHGLNHQVIFQQSRTEFKNDVRGAKELLEDISGSQVFGYMAPLTPSREKCSGHLKSKSNWASCMTRASFQ